MGRAKQRPVAGEVVAEERKFGGEQEHYNRISM